MKKLFKNKKILLILVGVLLIGGIGGTTFMMPKYSPLVMFGLVKAQAAELTTPTPTPLPQPGMMYDLSERVFNLGDPGGMRYAKIQIVIEFERPKAAVGLKGEALKKAEETFAVDMSGRRPMMDDILTTVIGNKTSVELSTPEGKEKLRQELMTQLADVSGEDELLSVYFTQFIIQ
jgi:flagellar protein FliL